VFEIEKTTTAKRPVCQKCKYHDRTFVPSAISGNRDIVIVGEAPGRSEAAEKIPFVGDAGKLLRGLLEEVGFDPSKVSYLNVIKCHPSDDNETPDKAARKICSKEYLFEELAHIRPKLIVLTGAVALNVFFPKDKITEKKGNFLDVNGIKFLPVLHPAYCLRNADFIPNLRRDLKKANLFLYGTLYNNRNYNICKTVEDLDKWKKVLLKVDTISVDIETNNTVDPFSPGANIWTIAFAYGKSQTVCMPLNHPEVVDPDYKAKAWDIVKEIMVSEVKKVFHNAVFDVKFLQKFGVKTNALWADTMVMSFLLDENRHSQGLKNLSSEYLYGCVDSWSEKLEKLAVYNSEDADNTLQLYNLFLPKLQGINDSLFMTFLQVIMPMIQVIADMELNGVKVNMDYTKELSRKYNSDLEVLKQLIASKFPESVGVNLRSNIQVAKLLFEKMGNRPVKKTDSGKESVDAEVLNKLSSQGCRIAEYLLKLHKIEKMLSTYIDNLPTMVSSDDRLRGSFLICGARSGRLSSRSPNLQNIPRTSDIKQMFVPKDGHMFINIDASQMELRVGCSVANDRTMILAYNQGMDVHKLTASIIMNKKIDEVTKEERQSAKASNFGLIYGQSADGFQKSAEAEYGLHLTLDQCRKFRDAFFKSYNGFLPWHERVKKELKNKGYVEYPTGRRRRFPEVLGYEEIPGEIFRSAVNSPVQGSGSDIMLFMMSNLRDDIHKKNLPVEFILTVHDSVLLECEERFCPDIQELVHKIATEKIPNQFGWLQVPMNFDFSIGTNWGEMKEITSRKQEKVV
jgi:uracil-DNA glycosylase family 4